MAKILSIETSTVVCSVAIHKDGKCIFVNEIAEPNAHSSKLTVLIEEMLQKTSLSIKDMDAIAISKGPGSYTGLRIGTSVAKGFCFACNIPLIAVDTLKALSLEAVNKLKEQNADLKNALLYPMLDARRMEVYTAEYSPNLECNKQTYSLVVEEKSISLFDCSKNYILFGDGTPKLVETLNGVQITYLKNIAPSAKSIGELAYESFINKDFEDFAYFEPFYLKEFQATTPKKNVLG